MKLSVESRIRRGRAYIRIVEAIDVLLANEWRSYDRNALLVFRRLVSRRLEHLVEGLEPAAIAQILAASEKVWSTVNDITLN